jgi:hypothetical protein
MQSKFGTQASRATANTFKFALIHLAARNSSHSKLIQAAMHTRWACSSREAGIAPPMTVVGDDVIQWLAEDVAEGLLVEMAIQWQAAASSRAACTDNGRHQISAPRRQRWPHRDPERLCSLQVDCAPSGQATAAPLLAICSCGLSFADLARYVRSAFSN